MRTGFLAEATTGGQYDINPLNVERAILLFYPAQVSIWFYSTYISLPYVSVIWGILIVIWEQLQSLKYKAKMDWN